MKSFPSALNYLPIIDDVPLILAGPILCHSQSDQITVWLALKEKRSLVLKVFATENNGASIGQTLLEGYRTTIQLGKHLHLIAITAQATNSILLQPGEIYAYDIYDAQETSSQSKQSSLINHPEIERYSLSYFDHQLPTFSLPPEDLNQLKIIHGSCRKPHGGGIDSLSYLDYLIRESASIGTGRPHQLFLTGDQIYSDDVADPILWLAQGVNQLLFGWSEQLPLKGNTVSADELMPGQRTAIARREAGLTAMLKNSPEKAKSHLFSFGEYAAVYLLSWSPILMPQTFPPGQSLDQGSQQADHWEQEINQTKSFIQDLSKVRRALANIPVYTICDDHDISDDWYLNREWCERVLGKPLGRRVVQNGILAYALFQAWGNTPEQFAPHTNGEKLFQSASCWLASEGKDQSAKAECDRYLGIPRIDPTTGLPELEQDKNVLILAHSNQALAWHYRIENSNHEVIVLDTRTWRGYPRGKNQKIQPPMLLSPHAFKQQLEIPLIESKNRVAATLIVLPTNLVALSIIDRIQQFELERDRVFNYDVGDAWNLHEAAFAQFLLTLAQHRERVIILSGDIHYSCAVRLSHWFHEPFKATAIAQLTSSAIKNSELASRIIHTKLKSLYPEKSRRWFGWKNPLKLEQVKQSWWQKQSNIDRNQALPDWQYKIEWCPRQPAEPLTWQRNLSIKDHRANLWHKLINQLISLFWRNRWLQEGSEVIGRNNLSLVRFKWLDSKTVIQETYWHPPWDKNATVKSKYEVNLDPEDSPVR